MIFFAFKSDFLLSKIAKQVDPLPDIDAYLIPFIDHNVFNNPSNFR